MSQEGQWKIESPNMPAVGSGAQANKLPYVSAIKITKDMEDGQKNFADVFNEMRSVLIANGLMENK